MTRRLYVALVVDPLAQALSAVVDVAAAALERTAAAAEAYADTARWWAGASRLVP